MLHTPIPQLNLACEGRIDFVQKTNPFGSTKKRSPEDEAKVQKQRAIFSRLKMEARNARKFKEASND